MVRQRPVQTGEGRRRAPGLAWALVSLLLLLLLAPGASALQFYFFFESSPGEGGGGGWYFTGSPRYKLYDCRICHVNTPGATRVRLWTEPSDVFFSGYRPGLTYTVHLQLLEETRAPAVKLFSSNNFCVEVLDGAGRNAGTFDPGFPFNPVSQLFDPVVLSPDGTTMLSGFFNPEITWQWQWTAPAAGTGPVTFYGGLVDGNGDLKTFGDDVAVIRGQAWEQ